MRHTWAMSRRHADRGRKSPLAVAGAALLLLVVAGAALPDGLLPLARPDRSAGVTVPDPPPLAGYLLAAIAVVLVGVWIGLQVLRLRMRAHAAQRGAPVWVQLLIVVIVLLLPTATEGGRRLLDRDGGSQTTSAENRPAGAADRAEAERSRALGIALTVLLGVLLGGMLAGIAFLFWPTRPPVDPGSKGQPTLIEGLEAGIEELELIGDPRRAVIACYARMEKMLAAAGIVRRPCETPLELLSRVLVQHRSAESSARRLTQLFERARFSPHRIDQDMRHHALLALREIRNQVAGEA
jgi:hypothetical protein